LAATNPVHVAVGVVVNEHDQVLISRRHQKSHLGGFWEFPGGKVEAEESVEDALRRELLEELGIEPERSFPLIKVRHHYADKFVLLDVWEINAFCGQPYGREGQDMRWQGINQLHPEWFPDANHAIIRSLQLPREVGITPNLSSIEALHDYLVHFSGLGVRCLQLRQPHLPIEDYRSWYCFARNICRNSGIKLIFNHRQGIGADSVVDGLHLTSDQLVNADNRPRNQAGIMSAACHNLEQLRRAESLGVDLALLSPVAPTAKYEGQDVLGWQEFEALAATVSLPVYALGGVRRVDLGRARAAGAFGIGGIGDYLPAG